MNSCPFCSIGAGEVDGELVAYRTDNVFVIPVPWQRARNLGHCLVLPTEHVLGLHLAPRDLRNEVFEVVSRVVAAVPEAFGACGTSVHQNNDIPGQTLPHLHVHVIPRYPDDEYTLPDTTTKSAIPFEVRVQQAEQLRNVLVRA